jgi:predicted nucleotidyltransferase
VLAAHPAVERATLYGSRAMGTFRPASDLDLCLQGEALKLVQLLRIEDELDELLSPYKIDLSLFQALDNPALIDHIRGVGVLFYEAEKAANHFDGAV